ncbi:hypothetical protein RUM43_004609 [Polyplax serrata]|uniref:Uncharacterized protein n=1 Tax=Polyplax serrata TaxID=468196 RepID=A0AAN8XNF6_POLSC
MSPVNIVPPSPSFISSNTAKPTVGYQSEKNGSSPSDISQLERPNRLKTFYTKHGNKNPVGGGIANCSNCTVEKINALKRRVKLLGFRGKGCKNTKRQAGEDGKKKKTKGNRVKKEQSCQNCKEFFPGKKNKPEQLHKTNRKRQAEESTRGEKASPLQVTHFPENTVGNGTMAKSKSNIQFVVTTHDFINERLVLKCSATIHNVYHRSSEISIDEEGRLNSDSPQIIVVSANFQDELDENGRKRRRYDSGEYSF